MRINRRREKLVFEVGVLPAVAKVAVHDEFLHVSAFGAEKSRYVGGFDRFALVITLHEVQFALESGDAGLKCLVVGISCRRRTDAASHEADCGEDADLWEEIEIHLRFLWY